MENIYLQTELERSSAAKLPDGFAENAGNTLYSWLGSLWRGLHSGDDMVRGLQASRGIRLAQMYLDIIEAANLKDRNGAPVFHRELWHPIAVRKSERDRTNENLLVIGGMGNIGPQTEEEPYGEGSVLDIGGIGAYKNYVTYPIDKNVAGGAMSIVDNIINPSVSLEKGKDFSIRNGAIIFRRENDPLGDGTPFERYDVHGDVGADGTLDNDIEAVLWASDVLIDRDYVSNFLSYQLGAHAPSSDVVKRILNAAWSSVSSGLTPELLRTILAAMMNIPVIQNDTETVIDISSVDGCSVVITDKGRYAVSPKAKIRKDVFTGAVLKRGDLLDESLRIYSGLNVKNSLDSLSEAIRLDIPSIVLQSGMLKARTEYGIYAMWGMSDVKRVGVDFMFDIGGTDEDVSAFWNNVWETADKRGIGTAQMLSGYMSAKDPVDFSPSSEFYEGQLVVKDDILFRCISGHHGPWDASAFERIKVSPAEFFLKNMVGANTIFVSVDGTQVDDMSMMRNPMFFDILSDVIPSAMRVFVVERIGAGMDDRVDMSDAGEDEFIAAALPMVVDGMSEGGLPGMRGRASAFGESVSVRFIRPSPVKVRGHKEEEK